MSSVAAAVLVVLIPSAAAASGGHAPESATNSTGGAPVTLTVSIVGWGTVVSNPAGISCGSICSAQFPDGTDVVLGPVPAYGYGFGSWSTTPPYTCAPYDIHDPNPCLISLADSVGTAVSVQATFVPFTVPPPCTVPGVQGKTLADAEALLTRTHCGVGTVTHVFSLKVQKGRVISQNPKAHWQLADGAVDLVVGKGRRKSHTAGRIRHGGT